MLDTETTGLPPHPDVRPLQVGAVALSRETGQEVSAFRVLLCPDVWAPSYRRAEQIHGLTRARCEAEGVGMRAGLDRFSNWLSSVGKTGPFVGGHHVLSAWNVRFDKWIIDQWRLGAWGASGGPSPAWPTFQVGPYAAKDGCMQACYRAWATAQAHVATPRYGALKGALQVFGLRPQPGVHDALDDARLAGNVWWAMEQDVRKNAEKL